MELLCIQTHSQGVVVAGNTYSLLKEWSIDCNCGTKTLVDIGVKSNRSLSECTICGNIRPSNGIFWVNKKLFAQIATEKEVKEAERTKELIEQ